MRTAATSGSTRRNIDFGLTSIGVLPAFEHAGNSNAITATILAASILRSSHLQTPPSNHRPAPGGSRPFFPHSFQGFVAPGWSGTPQPEEMPDRPLGVPSPSCHQDRGSFPISSRRVQLQNQATHLRQSNGGSGSWETSRATRLNRGQLEITLCAHRLR